MKVRKICAVLLSAVLAMPCAFADGAILAEDYTAAQGGAKPAGFTTWSKGGFNEPVPQIFAEKNVFGKGAGDVSGKILLPEGSDVTYVPYVRGDMKNIDTEKSLHLSFSAAAGDKNSCKAVYLTDTRRAVSTPDGVSVAFAADGGIYSYGRKIADYNTKRWYHFDVEVTGENVSIYIDGVKLREQTVGGVIGATTYLYYSMFGKTDAAAMSEFYTDDFSVEYGSVGADRLTELSSDTLEIGKSVISGVGKGMTAGELIGQISAGSARLAIITADGAEVSDDAELEPGMSLLAVSADGVNRRKLAIDCLGLVFNAPDDGSTTRDASCEVSVEFNGSGTVDFYVNGELYASADKAPYSAVIKHTEPGSYNVYAVVHVNGAEYRTEQITYTYAQNSAPTVSLEGITNGAKYDKSDVFEIRIIAADSDGSVEKTALYVDGAAAAEPADGVYKVGPLTAGVHKIYASATDNEGAEGRSETYTVTVSGSNKITIENTDFSGAHGWKTTGGSTEIITKDGNSYYKLTSNDGSSVALYHMTSGTNVALLQSRKVYFDVDLKLSDTNMTTQLFALRQSVAAYNIGGEIKNGMLEGYEIQPDKWYHYRHTVDIPNKISELWIFDEDSGEYKLLSRNTAMNTDGTWGGIRFNVNRYAAAVGSWELNMDNTDFYYLADDPYIEGVEYLASDGSDTEKNGKVGYNLAKIKLNLNNAVAAAVGAENIRIFAGGDEVKGFAVSTDGNSIVIELADAVRTLTDYEIRYSGITDANGFALADGKIEFSVGAAEYDALSWRVMRNGAQLASAKEIKAGDKIEVRAELVNQSAEVKNSKLIAVLYSGNKCIGASVGDIAAAADSTQTASAGVITVADEIDAELKLYAYIWSDLTGERQVQIRGLEFK